MSLSFKCYFARPFDLWNSAEEAIILKSLNEKGVKDIYPFEKDEIPLIKDFTGKEHYYDDPQRKLGRQIWINDLSRLRDSNLFLAWIPKPSLGTGAELIYALEYQRRRKFWNMQKRQDFPFLIQIISGLRHPLIAYALQYSNQLYNTIDDFVNVRQSDW